MSSLVNMTEFMTDEENIDNIPSEDLETAMENIVATIGGVMDVSTEGLATYTLYIQTSMKTDIQIYI